MEGCRAFKSEEHERWISLSKVGFRWGQQSQILEPVLKSSMHIVPRGKTLCIKIPLRGPATEGTKCFGSRCVRRTLNTDKNSSLQHAQMEAGDGGPATRPSISAAATFFFSAFVQKALDASDGDPSALPAWSASQQHNVEPSDVHPKAC